MDLSLEQIDAEVAKLENGQPSAYTRAELAQALDFLESTEGGGMTAANLARQAVGQGFGLGFGDEIEAGVKSFVGYNYDDELQRIRRANRRFEAANPGTALAANLVGGAGTMLVPGMGLGTALRSAGALGKIAGSVLPNAARLRAGTTTGLAIEGAKAGGLFGGLAGFGSGGSDDGDFQRGLESRIGTGVMTGGIGAVAGGLLAPVLGGALRAGAHGLDAATHSDDIGTQLLSKRLTESGFDVDDLIAKAVTGDESMALKRVVFEGYASGKTQASIVDDLAKAFGPNAPKAGRVSTMVRELEEAVGRGRTLVDVAQETTEGGARSLKGLARGANSIPSEGQSTAAGRHARRTLNQQDAWSDDIAEATGGSSGGTQRVVRDKLDDLREVFEPRYKAMADDNPIVLPNGDDEASPAAAKMAEMYLSGNSQLRRAVVELEEDSRIALRDFGETGKEYSFDLINQMQKKARKNISAAIGKEQSEEGLWREIREQLLDAAELQFTGFRELRAKYANEIADINAYRAGANVGVKSGGRGADLEYEAVKRLDQVRANVDPPLNKKGKPFGPRSKAYKEWAKNNTQAPQVRQGYGDSLIDEVMNRQATANPGGRILTTANKARIKRLLPEADANKLIKRLESRDLMRRNQNDIFGGSPTARIGQEIDQVTAEADLAAQFLTANVPGLLKSASNRIMRGITEKNASLLADQLSRMEAREVAELIQSLSKIQPRIAAANLWTGATPVALATGIINAFAQVD